MANRLIRPIRIVGNVAFVPLTQGLEAVIDADDVPIVEGFFWSVARRRHMIYAQRGIPGGIILMHRAIKNAPNGLQVDHIDRDGLNNRRANLRFATHAQNNQNKAMHPLNSSGFKGVSLYKPNGRWRAYIDKDGHRTCLGYFATPEEAHAAYVAAASTLHGDFANTGT
jgi:hypothetical protein